MMGKLLEQLKKPRWSPYSAGLLLGVVYIISLLFADHLLGASGSFENMAGLIGSISSTVANSVYFQYIMPAGISWQVILMVGIFLGAMVSSMLSGRFQWTNLPAQWREDHSGIKWKRWLTAFAGGMILEYGAGIAGGCTSGLAIAGSLQLAPAGFVFIIGLFASGILTSMAIYGRRWR